MQEFYDRFNEVNSEILICMASLRPIESVRVFDHLKLKRLAALYSKDFGFGDQMMLEHQLHLYIDNVREDERFLRLKDLGALGRLMMETEKHLAFLLIFRLLKLVLTLPIVIATVERCFSSMKM